MTAWIVPPLRRTVQALSISVLVLLPLLALYVHYKEARAIAELPRDQWQFAALHMIDRVAGENPQLTSWIEQTQGTFWSARLLGISVTDPLAGAEAIASSGSFYAPLLWSLLIPLVASILLGRFFCGWICPMNTLLELVDRGRRLLRFLELRPRDVKFSLRNKYVILAMGLGFAAVAGVPILAMLYPPAVLSREMHLWVFASGLGMGLYLILAICLVELFVSKRWWCRYVCPGGAVYSLSGRFRIVRVRRDENKCTACGDCVRACQFDLRPMLVKTTGMECTNCAACIASCSSSALSYRLVLPRLPQRNTVGKTGSKQNKQNKARTAAKVAGALLLVLLLPRSVGAHHILGLPHYSYKENYPQAPTLEYPAATGPYDILMTSYPGKPVPGEAATVAFYIKNRNTSQPYDRPVTVRVLQTFTFGHSKVIHEPATHQPFDNQHKYTVTLPEDGEYIIELTMDVEGQAEVIPFLVVAGEPTATASIVTTIAVALGLFLIVVRAIKVKRNRRRNTEKEQSAASRAQTCL